MGFKLRCSLIGINKKSQGRGVNFFKHMKRNASEWFLSLSYQGSLFTKVVSRASPPLRPHNPYCSPIQGVWFGQTIPSAELSALAKSKRGDPQPPKKYVVMQRRATSAKKSQVCFYLWKTFQQLLREACSLACVILAETRSPA